MSKKSKAFLFNLLGFSFFYTIFYFLVMISETLQGLWIAIASFVIATLLAPKFQAINTNEGEKLYMKWIFKKGLKVIN
ncbi:MAG TPA: hypothetical protein DDZ41_05940 [Flavobacterium sp.]|nr:hypothetical protein [Flavobacterium sp.]